MKRYINWQKTTNNNSDGKALIQENDEWRDEKEWDAVFEQLQKEQKNP